jgi:hypothetical protein
MLDARNQVLASADPGALRGDEARAAHNGLVLPEYGSVPSSGGR